MAANHVFFGIPATVVRCREIDVARLEPRLPHLLVSGKPNGHQTQSGYSMLISRNSRHSFDHAGKDECCYVNGRVVRCQRRKIDKLEPVIERVTFQRWPCLTDSIRIDDRI
ncbi:hypothetical protein D6T63_11050 [Arthrobacter cheniae]|uniref:Uncharacterized protein n=1 Tax=Arthrobacter cheniae TaxID=1258888 RepID=A0A3A5M0T2_9MICC|nr:hypothetical protein D6T63_11050 [Arthrobacter cheniae]